MKNRKINILLIFCALICLFSSNKLIAQNEEISTVKMTSIIVDEKGNPMSDVVVKAFNSKDIAVTRKDGSFEIEVSSNKDDALSILASGYDHKIVKVVNGSSASENIVLNKEVLFKGDNAVSLPYKETTSDKNVSSIYTISGKELESCPSTSLLQALAGLVPGLTIDQYTSTPGDEIVYAYIRNEQATTYVDGIARDVSDLSVFEVESVQILRDLSSRAALGIMGSSPVLWIVTKNGKSYNREVGVSAEYGMSMPTSLPQYVDAFDYATLYNQALANDGMAPYYSEEALQAYKNNSDPVKYPNVDYLSKYVKPSAPFMRANIDFSGGDKKVNYYTLFNYVGSRGLESMGETQKSDRFKLRANVNIKLNDFISMNVNLSGTYKTGRFLRGNTYIYNNGRLSVSRYNIFQEIARTPANAHPIYMGDKLIISDDYPSNIENDLLYTGYAETSQLYTQNNASLKIDLNEWVKGLSFNAMMCLDASGNIVVGKAGTANLYRIVKTSSGADSTELITPSYIDSDLSERGSEVSRKTVAQLSFNYENSFGKHNIFANATYFQGLFEYKGVGDYQPEKMQDLSLRFNYSYDNKYVIQIDPVLSGSMRLPKGKRFSLYPTAGLGWIVSNEEFLKDNKVINYLKVNASIGIMGTNAFDLSGYNSYYLHQTLWSREGQLMMGIPGKYSTVQTAYAIMQQGSDEYSLPKKRYFNIGLQSSMLDNSLAVEVNYFNRSLYDIISQKQSYTPSIFGGGQFLPATNFGEIQYYGVDGMVQYTKEFGDFRISAGANILYYTGKVVEWDEPLALEEYRKLTGKPADEFVMYDSEGLFQSQEEIDSREVSQTFSDLKPGDIKYVDYNNDGTIDEKDKFRTGAHSPRINYGMNLSLGFKGFEIKVTGQGVADGEKYIGGSTNTFNGVEYTSNSYFTSSGYKQNFSEAMLEAWPVSNNYPRLSINSINNLQESTFWLVDASYFRIKNVELSYTFPNKLTKSALMSDCRLYVRGSNLFETHALAKYGLDPENSNSFYYPIYKTFTIGVSCKF
jgi:TonB-linked SusC/RagA family outer membrane protein